MKLISTSDGYQIDLSLLDPQTPQQLPLTLDNEIVGYITTNADDLDIQITDKAPAINIIGTHKKKYVSIHANNTLTIGTPMTHCEWISLQGGEIHINSEMRTQILDVDCAAFTNKQVMSCDIADIQATQKVENFGSLSIRDKLSMNTPTIDCVGNIKLPAQSEIKASVLHLHDHGKIQNAANNKNDNHFTIDSIQLSDDAELQLKNSHIITKRIANNNQSKIIFKHNHIQSDFYSTDAANEIVDSQLDITKRLNITKNGVFHCDNTQTNTNVAQIIGECNLAHESSLGSATTNLSGKLKIESSSYQANKLITTKDSDLISSADAGLIVNELLLTKGHCQINLSNIDCLRWCNKGDLQLLYSSIFTPAGFTSQNQTTIDQCQLNAKFFEPGNEYKISNSEVQTLGLYDPGTGTWDHCLLLTKIYDANGSASTISNSAFNAETAMTGRQTIADSIILTNRLTQENGEMHCDRSNIIVGESYTKEDQSKLAIEDSNIHATTATASLTGQSDLNHSIVTLGNANLNATTVQHTEVMGNAIVFSGSNQCQDHSKILTNETLFLNGPMQLSQSQLATNGDLIFFNPLFISNQSYCAAKQLDGYGNFSLENESQAAVYDVLHMQPGTLFDINHSQSFAESMLFDGNMHADHAYLHAANQVQFGRRTDVVADSLGLQADNMISVPTHCEVSGTEATLKTQYLDNRGDIELTNALSIDADRVINEGRLNGGKLTKIDASRFLFNALGHIGGNTTLINTLASINMGDIQGSDNLIHNSLLNVNFGIMRGFNTNINNLLNLNLGLVLPDIPASTDAFLSWQHIYSASRMLLTNLFPHSANVINLVFTTLPIAKLLTSKICDVIKSDCDFVTACKQQVEQIKNMRVIDLLQYLCVVKFLFDRGIQIQHATDNVAGELKQISFESLKQDFENLPASHLIAIAGMAFTPTAYHSSIFNMNTGIATTQNKFNNNVMSVNTGIDYGWQTNTQNSYAYHNYGLLSGYQLALNGHGLTNAGYMNAHDFRLKENQVYLDQGRLHVTNFSGNIDHLPDPIDFINGVNRYQQATIDKNVALQTQDDININTSISRPGDIAITAPHLTLSASQEAQGALYFESRAGDLDLTQPLSAASNLTLKAHGDIYLHNLNYTANNDIYLDAGKAITNEGGQVIAGHDAYLRARDGSIFNIGGNLQGNNYLQAATQRDFINRCTEVNKQGPYDIVKEYTPGKIIGGIGDGHPQGLLIQADGKIISEGSATLANGDVVLLPREGYVSSARSHQYVSFEETKRHGLFHHKKSHTKVISAQVQRSENISTQGSVIVVSEAGAVTPQATDFLTANGTLIAAKDKVEFSDLIATETRFHKSSGLFGLTHKKRESYDEQSIPSVINNPSNVAIVSLTDDVILNGVMINGPGHLQAYAGNNIVAGVSLEDHARRVERSGFNLSLFGQTVISSNANTTHPELPFAQGESTYNAISRLQTSNNSEELILNSLNATREIINFGKDIRAGIMNNSLGSALLDHYKIGLIDPSLTLTFASTSENLEYQTVGAGNIHVGSLDLYAGKDIILNGIPVTIDHDATIECDRLIQNGLLLETNYTKKSSGFGISLGASNQLFDINYHRDLAKAYEKKYHQQHLYVGGNLNVNSNEWQLNNATTHLGSLTGELNQLNVTTLPEVSESKSNGFSFDTTGAFNVYKANQASSLFGNRSSFYVERAIDPEQFSLQHLHTKGEVEMSDLNPRSTLHEDVQVYKRKGGYVVSGNIQEFLPQPEVVKPTDEELRQAQIFQQLCAAVYEDRNAPANFIKMNTYYDQETHARVVSYINPQEHKLVLVFEGTNSFKRAVTDDLDIAVGKLPRSYNAAMQQFISKELSAYPDYHPYFTGHSIGAVEASLASHDYQYPAIAFETPGVYDPHRTYDFSRVTSYQGAPNLINSVGTLTLRHYNQGETFITPQTSLQKIQDELAQQLPGFSVLLNTIAHHRLKSIEAGLNNISDSNRFFKSNSKQSAFQDTIYNTKDDDNAQESYQTKQSR